MRYWLDTEFIAAPYSIDLISIGLVAEDGRNSTRRATRSIGRRPICGRLQTCVHSRAMERVQIGYAVRQFTDGDEHPVFWGYFPAYDWVAFTWLFGHLDELPFHYPQFCLDIKQWAVELGDPELPHQAGARHHALHDARWTRDAVLASLHPAGAARYPQQVSRSARSTAMTGAVKLSSILRRSLTFQTIGPEFFSYAL